MDNGPRNGGRATLNKILFVFRQKQEAVPVQAQSPFLSIHCLCLLPKPHSVTHCFYQTTITRSTVLFLWLWHTRCPGEHLLLFCCCSLFLNTLLGILRSLENLLLTVSKGNWDLARASSLRLLKVWNYSFKVFDPINRYTKWYWFCLNKYVCAIVTDIFFLSPEPPFC